MRERRDFQHAATSVTTIFRHDPILPGVASRSGGWKISRLYGARCSTSALHRLATRAREFRLPRDSKSLSVKHRCFSAHWLRPNLLFDYRVSTEFPLGSSGKSRYFSIAVERMDTVPRLDFAVDLAEASTARSRCSYFNLADQAAVAWTIAYRCNPLGCLRRRKV